MSAVLTPITAQVVPRRPTRRTGWLSPQHRAETATRTPKQGDPFPYHVVRYGTFANEGKVSYGHHLNYFTAIPQQQSIANKFFGYVRKVYRPKQTSIPRGRQRALGGDVNIETPEPMTFGDFATFSGLNRERIRTATRG